MSYGDEIIASGQARTLSDKTGHRVCIVDPRHGERRWSDLWDGLPWMVGPRENAAGAVSLANAPGCRPYIKYPFHDGRCRYSGWRCRDHPGAIALTEAESAFAAEASARIGPFVLVEPEIGRGSNPNKQWGRDRWQALVAAPVEGHAFVQVGPPGVRPLDGAAMIETASFRLGAAVLAAARLAVLPEGGLHHAAAALGTPAVVLFGGTVDAEAMGYPQHCNVVDAGDGSPCGNWQTCSHCAAAWERLHPETVRQHMMESLRAP